ncbi:MAG: hypothetical protein WAK03_05850 [Methylocystis sp.]
MGHFDLRLDEHAPHLAPRHAAVHHLTPYELRRIETREAPASKWRFAPVALALFALGFLLLNALLPTVA